MLSSQTPSQLHRSPARAMMLVYEPRCLDADKNPCFLQNQIEYVLENVPSQRQMMMFSATIPPHIRTLVDAYTDDPEMVDITKDASPESVVHKVKSETNM